MGSCLCEPTRLPVARGLQYGYDTKELSDLINPLRRYLRSCIGRPWAEVHSELSRKLDRRSVAGSHIWDHVMWGSNATATSAKTDWRTRTGEDS